jgi:hypothetical protein
MAPGTVSESGPSNSQIPTAFPAMHLDRLSFVGDFDGIHYDALYESKTSLSWEKWLSHYGVLGRRFAKYPYHYLIQTSAGYTVETKQKGTHIKDVRVDFNPAKTDDWRCSLPLLVASLKRIHITRLDFAIDYPLDLSEWQFLTDSAVKSCRFASASGKLETLYLGASSSPVRFRIYNKGLESGSPETLWRIEVQCRFGPNDNPFQIHPFKALTVSKSGEGFSVTEKALLHYLHTFPEAFGELTKDQRPRVKALLKSQHSIFLNPSPAEVFAFRAPQIIDTLAQIFSNRLGGQND